MSCISIEIDSYHTSLGQMNDARYLYASTSGRTKKYIIEMKRQNMMNKNILLEKAIFDIKYGDECARSPKLKEYYWATSSGVMHTAIAYVLLAPKLIEKRRLKKSARHGFHCDLT